MAYSLSSVSSIKVGGYLLYTSGTSQVVSTTENMHKALQSKQLSGREALAFTPDTLSQFGRITPR